MRHREEETTLSRFGKKRESEMSQQEKLQRQSACFLLHESALMHFRASHEKDSAKIQNADFRGFDAQIFADKLLSN